MTSYLFVLFFGLVSILSIQNADAEDIQTNIIPNGGDIDPLERAPASNVRVVDLNGNVITGNINVGDRIQIVSDFINNQDMKQPFTYIWQIQDEEGVVVFFSYFKGSLISGQSLSPAQSWTPSSAGTYIIQIFVWSSIDSPSSLSTPQSTTITVSESDKTKSPTSTPVTTPGQTIDQTWLFPVIGAAVVAAVSIPIIQRARTKKLKN